MAAESDSVQRLVDSDADTRDTVKLELLSELQRGRDIEDLRPVLSADDDEVVKAAVWIASELGTYGRPLLDAVVPLLGHSNPAVRFFALDGVLSWASGGDADSLGEAAAALEDDDSAVRWKAARVLAQASTDQLAGARVGARSARQARLLSWLLGDEARSSAMITARLDGPDELARRYAAIAAARLAPTDRTPLQRAAQSPDQDVREFAADTLALT